MTAGKQQQKKRTHFNVTDFYLWKCPVLPVSEDSGTGRAEWSVTQSTKHCPISLFRGPRDKFIVQASAYDIQHDPDATLVVHTQTRLCCLECSKFFTMNNLLQQMLPLVLSCWEYFSSPEKRNRYSVEVKCWKGSLNIAAGTKRNGTICPTRTTEGKSE